VVRDESEVCGICGKFVEGSEDGGGFCLKDGCMHGESSFASVEKGMLVKNGNAISYFVVDF
jgi:hypothetical protein